MTPTAPRESMMLKLWLSFSSCMNAGMGSPAFTSLFASCKHSSYVCLITPQHHNTGWT